MYKLNGCLWFLGLFLALFLMISCASIQQVETKSVATGQKNRLELTNASLICGNGVCDQKESSCTCPLDCGECERILNYCRQFLCNKGSCEPIIFDNCCGNGKCEEGENCDNCYNDCSCLIKDDLTDFPFMFESPTIVISINATPSDRDLALELQSFFKKDTLIVTEKAFDTIFETDSIFIGRPCDNSFIAESLQEWDCNNFLSKGEGMILLMGTSSKTKALIITGNKPSDTRRAGRVLIDYTKHNLSGNKIMVLGSLEKPEIRIN